MSAAFCLGLIGMLCAVSVVLTPTQGIVNPWPAVRRYAHQADVLALGSSHTHCTVLPMELWRETGVTALDVTSGGQVIPVTLSYLEESLKHQNPRVVLLEVHMVGATYRDIASAHNNLDYMPAGLPRVRGITRSVDASNWPEFFLPLQVYHSRWRELRAADFFPLKQSWYSYARGALYLPEVKPLDGDTSTLDVDEDAYQSDLSYLRKIAATCEARCAQLVLFASPSVLSRQVGGVPMLERLESDLSPEFASVRYLDLNSVAGKIGISYATDYKDEDHLNQRGAVKITRWLARYLVREFGLPDRRRAAFARRWDDDLRRYDELFVSGW